MINQGHVKKNTAHLLLFIVLQTKCPDGTGYVMPAQQCQVSVNSADASIYIRRDGRRPKFVKPSCKVDKILTCFYAPNRSATPRL